MHFLFKAHHSVVLHLGTLDSTSALLFQAILKVESPTKCKNHGAKQTMKGDSMRADTRRQGIALFGGNVHVGQSQIFTLLHVSSDDSKSTVSMDLGLQMNFSKEAESANSEDWLYLTSNRTGAPTNQKRCKPHYLRLWGLQMSQERILWLLSAAGSMGAQGRAWRKSLAARVAWGQQALTNPFWKNCSILLIQWALLALANVKTVPGWEIPNFPIFF